MRWSQWLASTPQRRPRRRDEAQSAVVIDRTIKD
jgi:hypothetical protein